MWPWTGRLKSSKLFDFSCYNCPFSRRTYRTTSHFSLERLRSEPVEDSLDFSPQFLSHVSPICRLRSTPPFWGWVSSFLFHLQKGYLFLWLPRLFYWYLEKRDDNRTDWLRRHRGILFSIRNYFLLLMWLQRDGCQWTIFDNEIYQCI